MDVYDPDGFLVEGFSRALNPHPEGVSYRTRTMVLWARNLQIRACATAPF